MTPPRITADDVRHGVYFMRVADGSLWRVLTYADQPTATLERVDWPVLREGEMPVFPIQPPRVGGVVGAPIFDDFVRLVPDPNGP